MIKYIMLSWLLFVSILAIFTTIKDVKKDKIEKQKREEAEQLKKRKLELEIKILEKRVK